MHRGIECVGEGIGGAYELSESGVDVGRRDVEAAATALGGRMGEAERLPEIVVAREGKKGAGDVLEVDELGGFEVRDYVEDELVGQVDHGDKTRKKRTGALMLRVGDNGGCDTRYLGHLRVPPHLLRVQGLKG